MDNLNERNGVISFALEKPEESKLIATFNELLADLANASPEIQSNAIRLLKDLSKLATIDSVTTPGAAITILFKPSDFLLDVCIAVRTGKFDNLIVGNEHSFSSVDSGLRELPSLSTLEKLPMNAEKMAE
ncbi:hypothetical protein [Nitrosomonas oligotropha]|uniref:hypothetical protein n=1 Tax=Nitrosomonas oligotropha TaxID=42354 RepID=UPI00136FAB41|nr:hypothetical protein [Nitrosomonas oligotropha]MXS81554.1 hypothetical protein [Nitrosomonas oligotropha]